MNKNKSKARQYLHVYDLILHGFSFQITYIKQVQE